jgi:hypothetical protein
MAEYFQLFKINHNVSAQQIKRSAILLLPMGLFITVGAGALLALVLGAPIPDFLMPDSMRIDESARVPTSAGAIILLSGLTAFGLITIAEALWRIFFSKRNVLLMRIMLIMVAVLMVAGFIASSMQGVRFGTLNA